MNAQAETNRLERETKTRPLLRAHLPLNHPAERGDPLHLGERAVAEPRDLNFPRFHDTRGRRKIDDRRFTRTGDNGKIPAGLGHRDPGQRRKIRGRICVRNHADSPQKN